MEVFEQEWKTESDSSAIKLMSEILAKVNLTTHYDIVHDIINEEQVEMEELRRKIIIAREMENHVFAAMHRLS